MQISTAALIAGFVTVPPPTQFAEYFAATGVAQDPVVRRVRAVTDELVLRSIADVTVTSTIGDTLAVYGVVADKLGGIQVELNNYRSFEDGWDGPDSLAPAANHIDSALAFVSRLPAGLPLPKPMLSSTGQVGLYWNTNEMFADIEFIDGDRFSLYARQKSGQKPEAFEPDVDLAQVNEDWFARFLLPYFS